MRFLLFTLMVFNSFFGFNQNINKIYKTIKKGKFDVAYEELKTFQKTTNQNEESVALGIVAEIMIFGSNKYSGYNPYNSLDLLRENKSILERNISQVNEKLVKLNTEYLSLESQYLKVIYEDAVKFNDEILFYKAKQYCGECQFKDSLNYYLELNVYNSAKTKRTIEECNRFIFDFSSSKKVTEITELRNLIAFEKIKQQPNLTKINEYLQIYPSSKHFESVTIMRDSIEYASLKEDYQEHLNYIIKYPNSAFNGIIKDKLPKLLFNEVLKTNKSDEYIKFLETYPNYTSVTFVKDKLENTLYGEIKSSPSIIKLQQYKKYFPSNNRIEELYKLILAQIDTNLFNQVEKSKLLETIQQDYAKIERYEKGNVIYSEEGYNMPGPEKRIEIFIDSVVYSRHINKKGIFHYKTDLKSKNIKTLKHGEWTLYHLKSGYKLVEVNCNFINDTIHGERLVYEYNSFGYFLEKRNNFKLGIPDGLYEKYDQNGKLKVKGQFLNGEKVGVWIINENDYHNPNGGDYWSKCDYCYFTTKSTYREFYPDGIMDAEIKINNGIAPHLRETYDGSESNRKQEIHESDSESTIEWKKQGNIEWEKLRNLIIAPFINSKLIKTEYYKNNEFISCEGDCD